ncbi:GNAT family N-acetyltransferase [Legionella sp. 16cNR16C]|uniref:GNAT family N-acetyltransferase n=1 Tax=Legionella sp. 16cNR16C TaxID=2905656 RepID=UPI001E2DBFD4|nr:GNAT family N-acetyltransferase [Legionella sp. 16cNR16C]MCE3044389.1 GNAT family N-acetyltransferase [Legionella sp. 16cNR16C]
MEYRNPETADFEKMVELQNENLAVNLASDLQDGFLSAGFTAEQFKEMDADLGIIVGVEDKAVCAYQCASTLNYNKNVPLVQAMIDQFNRLKYQGKSLADYQTCVYGPVCIAKTHRGKNVMSGLFEHMSQYLKQAHPEIDMLTVLVSKSNPRSVNAHKKLGMEVIGDFQFNGSEFVILVYPAH